MDNTTATTPDVPPGHASQAVPAGRPAVSGLDELAGAKLSRLVPAATALVWAVRTGNTAELGNALTQATTHAGWDGPRALVVLLAAMVPDDEPPSQLLGWLDDPDGYLRMREQGVSRVDAIATIRLNTSM